MKKQIIIVVTLALLVVAFFGGRYWYQHQQTALPKDSVASLERPYAPTFGKANAKVTIVEFFDPACETCRAFYPYVKGFLKEHPDKIRLVLRHVPFHSGSDHVIRMLEASKLQDKYTQMLEVVYKYQDKWTINHKVDIALIWPLLPEAGIDVERLQNDMKKPEVEANVKQDIADVNALGIRQTPEFFVNGKPLKRFGYKELKELVESEL